MLFNSVAFLFFFPIVTVLYFILPQRTRWFLLLSASCFFYMAFIPAYILILFFIIGVDYIAGRVIEGSQGRTRALCFAASIAVNIGTLFLFKYFNFFSNALTQACGLLKHPCDAPYFEWVLPLGLSFHTFQALSYTFEVYRGHQRAERHLGIYALYVMFYPQLVAGPIERPQNLIHQFREKHSFEYQRVTKGLKLMAWGMFKKVVIADRLAEFVNQVFDTPHSYHGIPLIIAIVFFAFQIYCDFSGYSDIAIGAAEVMGFKLMRNFRTPYFASSITDFWKRWHISLSSWFRDYVYIPLGGNRTSRPLYCLNIMIVFLLSGLWHGANWTYLVWGGLNGVYVLVGKYTKALRFQICHFLKLTAWPLGYRLLQTGTTFGLTCFAWIFFRAKDLNDAYYIMTNMGFHLPTAGSALSDVFLTADNAKDFIIVWFCLIILIAGDLLSAKGDLRKQLAQKPAWLRWSGYYALILAILLLGRFGNDSQQFIYFNF